MDEEQAILERFRRSGVYSAAHAAELTGATRETVRRWVHSLRPSEKGSPTERLSFLDLAEVAIMDRFRRPRGGHPGIRLSVLRKAREYAMHELGIAYPFASLDLQRFGPDILYNTFPAMVLNLHGQPVFPPVVEAVLGQFRYDDFVHLAYEWYPLGMDVPIVINPLIAAGEPVIEGTAARVESIKARIAAGDSRDLIIKDYGISQSAVDQALKYAA